MPWLLALGLYAGTLLNWLLNWGGLLLTVPLNFIIPCALYLLYSESLLLARGDARGGEADGEAAARCGGGCALPCARGGGGEAEDGGASPARQRQRQQRSGDAQRRANDPTAALLLRLGGGAAADDACGESGGGAKDGPVGNGDDGGSDDDEEGGDVTWKKNDVRDDGAAPCSLTVARHRGAGAADGCAHDAGSPPLKAALHGAQTPLKHRHPAAVRVRRKVAWSVIAISAGLNVLSIVLSF